MLTFRHLLLFGMMFVLISCGTQQKITNESSKVIYDFKDIISQLESSSNIIDATNLRIELRYSSGDPRETPSAKAVSNEEKMSVVAITADTFHLNSCTVRSDEKLNFSAVDAEFENSRKKVVHNKGFSYIYISAVLSVVAIIICRKFWRTFS